MATLHAKRALMTAGFLALLASSCQTRDSTSPSPAEEGELRLTITRSATSQIPVAAESAGIRIWHPTAGTNQVRWIAIPQPGTTTDVTLTVPARTGYSVAVIAYHRVNEIQSREALAGGRADNLAVSKGATTDISVSVVPWVVDFAAPDSLISGEATSALLTVTQGPVTDFIRDANLHYALSPWASYADLPTSLVTLPPTGNQISLAFTAPTVATDTTFWFQWRLNIDHLAWQTNSLSNLFVFVPSLTLSQSLQVRPLKLPTGLIHISF